MPSKPYKILCIEADDDFCDLLSLYLDQESFRVDWAKTLRIARRFLESERFNLCLINEGYLDGTGLEFIREIRASGSKIPIIYQSAYAFPEHILEGIDAGASFYLIMPFNMEMLVAKIKQIINSKDQFRAAH